MLTASCGVLSDQSNDSKKLRMVDSFQLTDHNGKTFNLEDVRGKLVLMFFGYTSCPDVCPTGLSTLSQLLTSLKSKANKVKVLFITVDPERDTPKKLNQYVSFFNPQIVGLSGTTKQISEVTRQYLVQNSIKRQYKNSAHYSVSHSANLYLLNGEGKLASIIPFGLPLEHIQKTVEIHLNKLPS